MIKNIDKLANLEKNSSGEKQLTILDVELDRKDLDSIYNALDIVSEYNRVKNIYNMAIENGNDLYRNIKLSSDVHYLDQNKVESNDVVMSVNKSIFNYCSSIGMYIDIIEKSLSKMDKVKMDSFRKECNYLYDNKLEYRFFVIMRNYILHYDLPFTVHERTENSSKVICLREHLLKFKSWKHVKKDIENMDEEIDIISMIEQMNVSLTILLLQYQYLISKNVIDSWEIATKFIEKYGVSNPFIIKDYSIESYKKGNLKINPLGLDGLQSIVKELMNHPKISITTR